MAYRVKVVLVHNIVISSLQYHEKPSTEKGIISMPNELFLSSGSPKC